MTQKYQVKVSMKQAAIVETGIVLKQGDFGIQIEIEVLDFDATGTTPQIVFRKAQGAVESTTITVSGNKYTYTFVGTELDTPGKCFCDLKLKNSTTQRISTASFAFKVIADTLDGLNEHANSYSDTIGQIWQTLTDYSEDSEAWAKGTKSGTPVPSTATQYHNNAKYYSEESQGYSEDSQDHSEDSEAWAAGTKNGTPVDSSAAQYHNNAKYYSDLTASTSDKVLSAKTFNDSYTDLNQFMEMGIYSLPMNNVYANDPIGSGKRRTVITISNYVARTVGQIIYERNNGNAYFRLYTDGEWKAWGSVINDLNTALNSAVSEINDSISDVTNNLITNYENDTGFSAEELLIQHEKMRIDEFTLGYIASSTGEEHTDLIRYYYPTEYLDAGTVIVNTDPDNIKLGNARYNLDNTFYSFTADSGLDVMTLSDEYKFKVFAYFNDKDVFANRTQLEAIEAFEKVLFIKPNSKAINKSLGGIKELHDSIDSEYTLPISAGLKWDYFTVNGNGSLSYNRKRLGSEKIKCQPFTRIEYNGDTSDDAGNGFFVVVCQYNNNTFMSRKQLYYNSENTPVITDPGCTHVLYNFGYTSSQDIGMMPDYFKYFSVECTKPDTILPVVDSSTTWELKNINDSGVVTSNQTRILSQNILCTDKIAITFTGAVENSDHVPRFAMVAQFDKTGTFISRKKLYVDGAYTTVITAENCGSIRFLYGHAASAGVTVTTDIAADFSFTAVKKEQIEGTYSISFGLQLNTKKQYATLITIKSKYTGTQPTVGFSTSLYNSPVYSIGKEDYTLQTFRIPPALADGKVNISFTIADNSSLTIDSFEESCETSARTSWNSGFFMNAHLGFRQMCPENTRAAVDMAGRLGYKSCIVVPKMTSDGQIVCIHDDTINRTARNNDGTSLSEDIAVADSTYAELLEYDFGLYKGEYWKGERILLFEDFLNICAQYGMIPTISVHPRFTQAQYESMKTMIRRKNLLDIFHIKFWGTVDDFFSVFGNDIGEYTFINGSIASIQNAKETLNINGPKLTFESDSREWYTEAHIQEYVDAGIPVVHTTATSSNMTGAQMAQMIQYGVSQVTDDTFCNNGLMWLP